MNNNLNTNTIPTLVETTTSIADTVNKALASISDIQVDLEKPDTFLNDTLNGFFYYYGEYALQDTEKLKLMWYAARSYRVYVESTIEYIRGVLEKLQDTHDSLQGLHMFLKGDE